LRVLWHLLKTSKNSVLSNNIAMLFGFFIKINKWLFSRATDKKIVS
jgi:hypothetical protein